MIAEDGMKLTYPDGTTVTRTATRNRTWNRTANHGGLTDRDRFCHRN